MKKSLMTLMFMAFAMTMMAVPAKRGLSKTLTLADGTQVIATLVGDEHGHWMQAQDGTCYVKGKQGYVEVSRETVMGKRQARIDAKYAKRRAVYATTSDGLGEKGTMSRGAVPSIGEYTIPVVMVQFSDVKFKSTTTVEKMTRFYNQEGYKEESGCKGSVRDYFKSQSGGQFIPTFDVVGIVTLTKASTYYGKDKSEDEIDINMDQLPGDVISAAISQLGVDFSKYVVPAGDSYHKQGVPLMCMLYAGQGEATGGSDDSIWPCEWDAEEDPAGQGTYSNVHFNSFFVGNELLDNKLMGMAVFCHEFGHALGLPDFYVTDYSYESDDPFGHWSIMDTGAYVDDECRAPMGYNAYEKSYMGWLELKEIGDAKEVTLQSPFGLAENSAYIIRHSLSESFIFENRQPGDWYPSTFGSGLLVSRINYSYNAWNTNTLNNTQSKKRACALTADGAKMNYSASYKNLYGNGKNLINTLKTYSGSSKTIGITAITKNADGTIKLSLNESDTPTGDYLFYESFDNCNGTGANDDNWGSSVAGKSSTFIPDNDGWESVAYYGGSHCARFGSGKTVGIATTPAIKLTNDATLTFRAAAWSSDGTALSLSAEGATIVFEPEQLTMKRSQWTDYTVKVSGSGTARIVFRPSKRFFLDEVLLKASTTGIETVNAVAAPKTGVYTLDGRYMGTDDTALPHGLYIVNGKKMVK